MELAGIGVEVRLHLAACRLRFEAVLERRYPSLWAKSRPITSVHSHHFILSKTWPLRSVIGSSQSEPMRNEDPRDKPSSRFRPLPFRDRVPVNSGADLLLCHLGRFSEDETLRVRRRVCITSGSSFMSFRQSLG